MINKKKDNTSNRSNDWLLRNDLSRSENVIKYVKDLCLINFKFKNFEIKKYGKETFLIVIINNIYYIVVADQNKVLLRVVKQIDGMILNFQEFDRSSAWMDCLKYIENDGG